MYFRSGAADFKYKEKGLRLSTRIGQALVRMDQQLETVQTPLFEVLGGGFELAYSEMPVVIGDVDQPEKTSTSPMQDALLTGVRRLALPGREGGWVNRLLATTLFEIVD